MEVVLIATRDCSHCQNFSRELDAIGITHQVRFAEDVPDLCQDLNIRHSPNLVVDGIVVFREQPAESELRDYFKMVDV